MSKWRKLRQLKAADVVLITRMSVLLPTTSLALRALGFQRVNAIYTRLHQRVQRQEKTLIPESEEACIGRTLALARVVVRFAPYRATCLPRSLVLQHVLRLQKVETNLRIGVSGEGNGFEAHAWIEYHGRPLGEREADLQRFRPFNESINRIV